MPLHTLSAALIGIALSTLALATLNAASTPTASPAHTPTPATNAPDAPTPTSIHLNIAQNTPGLNNAIDKGLQSLLLGHSEAAKHSFLHAQQLAPDSPIAACGLMLACSGIDLAPDLQQHYTQAQQQLKKLDLNTTTLHPQEERYLNGLTLLLSQNYQQAGDHLAQLAEQYRGDLGLAQWAILLLHDTYSTNGQASPRQQQALQLAEQSLQRKPNNALLHYLRALLEENAPHISPQALQSINLAITAMPEQPMPQLLKGHLLYRNAQNETQLEESLNAIIQAEQKASAWQKQNDLHWRENSPWLRARLYHLTILHQLGRQQEYLQLYVDTIQHKLPLSTAALEQQKSSLSIAEHLYYWELKTHPLRMDFSADKRLSQSTLNASIDKERLNNCNNPALNTLPHYAQCLATFINAQRSIDQGKTLEAQRALKEGIALREELLTEWSPVEHYTLNSNLMRAIEACDIAMNIIRAQLFTQTTQLWEDKLKEVTRSSSMLMPPVMLIERAGNKAREKALKTP